MEINNDEIIKYLDEIGYHLKASNKTALKYDSFWSKKFKDSPAVYAFFNKEKLVYIGETSSLKKRMSDIRRTYNHTFRKKIGDKIFGTKPNTKGVFSSDNEIALNTYFEKHISVTFYYKNFGRLEAESYLIHKNKGEDSNSLINKIGKRDIKVINALMS